MAQDVRFSVDMSLRPMVASAMAAFGLAVFAIGCSDDYAAERKLDGDDPAATGTNASALCGEMAKVPERCASAPAPSACAAKLVASCDGFSRLLNPNLVSAAATCVAGATCDEAPTSCLAKMARALEPTGAQTALAKAFCTSCSPVSGAACEATFLSKASPLGKVLLPLGDDVADEITATCATGAACAATFASCAQGVVTKSLATSLDKDAAECLLQAIVGAAAGATSAGDAGASGGGEPSDPEPSGPPPGASSEPTYDVYLRSVEAPATDTSGWAWDAFGGLPDLSVTVAAVWPGNRFEKTLAGPVDTLVATFATPFLTNVPASVFASMTSPTTSFEIKVEDADIAANDAVGSCASGSGSSVTAPKFSASDWKLGQKTTIECKPTSEAGFKVTYELVARPR